MLKAVRASLEAYASGVGRPAAEVIREFKALPEGDKFRVLSNIRELEKMHQQWEANGGKPPAPPPAPPEEDSARAAREMRAEYLRTGSHPRDSALLDRFGRPIGRR